MIIEQINFLRHFILDPNLVITRVITIAASIDDFGELGVALEDVLLDAVDFGLGLVEFVGEGLVEGVLGLEFGLHLLEFEGDAEDDCLLFDLAHLQVVFGVLYVRALLFQFIISLLLSFQVLIELIAQVFLRMDSLIGQVVDLIKRDEFILPHHEIEPLGTLGRVLIVNIFLLFFELLILIELHLFEHCFGHEIFGELEPFFFDQFVLILDDFL
jgi:hypothetical protein